MAKTDEERRAYAKGYHAGRSGYWPEGVPPVPDELVLKLIKAAKKARDFIDTELAQMYDEDGEFEKKFGPAIDAVDEALSDLTEYAMTEVNKTERSNS